MGASLGLAPPADPLSGTQARLFRWQILTAGTLLLGYAGYYICRSDLAVATPLILADLGPAGIDKKAIGLVSSLGILTYAVGKLLNGVLGDVLGGRPMFLLGMVGAVGASVWFGLGSGLGVLLLAWGLNRFFQSAGWGALVKVTAHWFSPARQGTIMGILSLSFLFGDALGRLLLGSLISRGLGWRGVVFCAAAILALIAVVTALLLKPTPADLGLPPPSSSPGVVFAGQEGGRTGVADLVVPYFRHSAFWYVCGLSFGLTLIREAFNTWIPTYLVEAFGMSKAGAAQASALFPFAGGLSVILVGMLSDRVRGGNRVRVALPFLVLATLALLALARVHGSESRGLGLLLIAGGAFLLIGPYSLCAGALAADLGGQRGASTAAGLIDGAGYAGGLLSGYALGAVVEAGGWGQAFTLLAGVSGLTTLVAYLYCRERPGPPVLEVSDHAH